MPDGGTFCEDCPILRLYDLCTTCMRPDATQSAFGELTSLAKRIENAGSSSKLRDAAPEEACDVCAIVFMGNDGFLKHIKTFNRYASNITAQTDLSNITKPWILGAPLGGVLVESISHLAMLLSRVVK